MKAALDILAWLVIGLAACAVGLIILANLGLGVIALAAVIWAVLRVTD